MKFSLLNPVAVVLLVLLAGCGKAQPNDQASAEAADNPTEVSQATPDDEPMADNDKTAPADNYDGDNSPTEASSRPVAAEAIAITWVCTWCHEEYTSDRQPTSFQPGKCSRNPGKAHAWHKK